MNLYENKDYMNQVEAVARLPYAWNILCDKSLAISGATGMIGSFLIDVLMYRNTFFNQKVSIYAFSRNEQKAMERFSLYKNNDFFHVIEQDINEKILPGVNEQTGENELKADYVIHGASNTHPVAYSNDPIGTIAANVIGTNNLLKWASKSHCCRFVFLSSVEIYGENKGDIDKFSEDYCGYIDCNTLRAGYPESKRTGEALCQAYIKQENMDIVIPRLSRVYGPTMLMSDTKAISQFIKKSACGEDIILKSEGTQYYSYCYVADAVAAILKIMFDGKRGVAYNVASRDSDIMLKDLAGILANKAGKKVIFELPDAVEKAGYSTATKATLDLERLKELGFESMYGMKDGLEKTVDILKSIM